MAQCSAMPNAMNDNWLTAQPEPVDVAEAANAKM